MSSLLTGETASNNYNVAKVFAGENPNKEASGQLQTNFLPPTKIFKVPILRVRKVPNIVKMIKFDPVKFKAEWVDTQMGTKDEYYFEE